MSLESRKGKWIVNSYRFRINNNEPEMIAAMDVQNYSHMTPMRYDQRFVIFSANNYREAVNYIMLAMGKMYRRGTHVPFLVS